MSAGTFRARFAELVYLLAHEPDATFEHERVLSELVAASAAGDATLTTSQLNVDLQADGQSAEGVRLHELAMRMAAHSAHQIDFLEGTPVDQILGVARIVAGEARPNDDGVAFDYELIKVGITHVEVHLGRNGFVRSGSLTPSASPLINGSSRQTPASLATVDARRPTPRGGALVLGSEVPAGLFARRTTPPVGPPAIRDDSNRMFERAFKAKSLATLSDDELIERLRTGLTPQNVSRVLDEVASVAEARAGEGRWDVVARVLAAFVDREVSAEDAELRRAYTIAVRRLTKPTLIRGIAVLLPRRPELRDPLHAVLLRLGSDGAEALIDLLGEMRAPEAENALLEVVTHREERVRRSAATALARLGTLRSVQAVEKMAADAVPEVRAHAAQGLGGVKSSRAVAVLARALDRESDPEVQAVILAALGRQATDEAVTRLTKAAEPDGRLFKRKPTALRLAAVQALAEANTPAALAALRRFADDRERDVRVAASRALRPT